MSLARIAVVVVCMAGAGCVSPESTRARGGGRGADVGNRSQDVKMHEGSEPYWNTPDRIVGEHAPLDASRQARDISRR